MTLALTNFRRELPEMVAQLTGQTKELGGGECAARALAPQSHR